MSEYKFYKIEDVRAAIDLFEDAFHCAEVGGGWGSKLVAIFQVTETMTAKMNGRYMKKIAPRRYEYCESYEATHVKFDTWVMDNFHFYGKNARSSAAWKFADSFFGMFANVIDHTLS